MKKLVLFFAVTSLLGCITSCSKSEKAISREVEQLIIAKSSAEGHSFRFVNGLHLRKTSEDDMLYDIFGMGRSEYADVTKCEIDNYTGEFVINAVVNGGKISWGYRRSNRQIQIDDAREADLMIRQYENQQREFNKKMYEMERQNDAAWSNFKRQLDAETEKNQREIEKVLQQPIW